MDPEAWRFVENYGGMLLWVCLRRWWRVLFGADNVL
jgi:hypothetical protein